jgi:outer membrane biosynthesis protein TonB
MNRETRNKETRKRKRKIETVKIEINKETRNKKEKTRKRNKEKETRTKKETRKIEKGKRKERKKRNRSHPRPQTASATTGDSVTEATYNILRRLAGWGRGVGGASFLHSSLAGVGFLFFYVNFACRGRFTSGFQHRSPVPHL